MLVCAYVYVCSAKVKELFKLFSDKSISIFMSFVLLIINNVLIERAAVCSDGRVLTQFNMAVCVDSPYSRQHNTHPCLSSTYMSTHPHTEEHQAVEQKAAIKFAFMTFIASLVFSLFIYSPARVSRSLSVHFSPTEELKSRAAGTATILSAISL